MCVIRPVIYFHLPCCGYFCRDYQDDDGDDEDNDDDDPFDGVAFFSILIVGVCVNPIRELLMPYSRKLTLTHTHTNAHLKPQQ